MFNSQNKTDHKATNTTHPSQEPEEGISMKSHWSGTKGPKDIHLILLYIISKYYPRNPERETVTTATMRDFILP